MNYGSKKTLEQNHMNDEMIKKFANTGTISIIMSYFIRAFPAYHIFIDREKIVKTL